MIEDEQGIYGQVDENRHMVECFRTAQTPIETFADGVAVELLRALYKSAGTGRTVTLPADDLEDYVPPAAGMAPFPVPPP